MATTGMFNITSDLINNGLIIGIVLIAFLVLKEVFSADMDKNEKTRSFVRVINFAIVPLFLIFIIFVVYKAMEVLSSL